ncbi:MAG: hypothetical protein DMG24_06825 [Acidobacteria bacterium]|nr:MAG: hypothetical protein DMG24_06825 [Acidobacteriota bacterium]
MQAEETIVKAQQSKAAVGTSSDEGKKSRGRKCSRQSPGQGDQKGEMISPLTPLALTELPPDFDFIASKTDDEKVEYIQSVLVRSEDEAIALIAPALQAYGTAVSVVQAYMPLILEVKKHLCRPKTNPQTGERSRTWEEICNENFHISIRRMQQILASLKQPKRLGGVTAGSRKPPVDRDEYERATRVAVPARSLAEAIIKQGLGGKFPEAVEILKVSNVPVPGVQPAAIPNGAGKDPDWKAILTELVTTLERYGDRLPLLVLSQMRGVEKVLDLQLGQLPPSEPMAPAAKRYHVKKRTKSNTTDFIVMRDGDKSRYRVQSFRYRKRSPGGLRGVEHVARCQHRRQLDWASAGQGHGIPPFRSPIGEEPEHETLDTAHVQRSGLDGRGVRQATSILRLQPPVSARSLHLHGNLRRYGWPRRVGRTRGCEAR